MDISTSFPYRIPEGISSWKFPLYFPQNFKMRYNYIRRVPVVRKYPSDDLRSFVIEFKMFTVLGILPFHFNLDLKNPLNFPVDSHFTYNPSFCVGSLHQPQGIPRRIRVILPARVEMSVFFRKHFSKNGAYF